MTEDSISHYEPPKDITGEPEPSPPQASPLKPKRPGAPFGIGLTLIICGSLAALFGIFGGLFSMAASSMMSGIAGLGAMANDPAGKQAFDAMMAASKPIYMIQGLLQVIMGIISVLALVAGIGLVKYRRWGRKLALAWAGVAVAYILASTIINFVYILPKSKAMMQAMMGAMPEGGGTAFSGIMSGVGGVSQILYSLLLAVLPVLTFILISKEKVKNCLS